MGQEQSAADSAHAVGGTPGASSTTVRPTSLRKRVSESGSISGRPSLSASGASGSLADRIAGSGLVGALGQRSQSTLDATVVHGSDSHVRLTSGPVEDTEPLDSPSEEGVVIVDDTVGRASAADGSALPRGAFVAGASAAPLRGNSSFVSSHSSSVLGSAREVRRDRDRDSTGADKDRERDRRRGRDSAAGSSAAAASPAAASHPQPPPISKEDFNLLKVIGKGSFGKVFLVQKRGGADDGVTYAMKTLRKEVLLRRNQIEHTKTERAVLQAVDHPFIVCLRYAFQTTDKLYLVRPRI